MHGAHVCAHIFACVSCGVGWSPRLMFERCAHICDHGFACVLCGFGWSPRLMFERCAHICVHGFACVPCAVGWSPRLIRVLTPCSVGWSPRLVSAWPLVELQRKADAAQGWQSRSFPCPCACAHCERPVWLANGWPAALQGRGGGALALDTRHLRQQAPPQGPWPRVLPAPPGHTHIVCTRACNFCVPPSRPLRCALHCPPRTGRLPQLACCPRSKAGR